MPPIVENMKSLQQSFYMNPSTYWTSWKALNSEKLLLDFLVPAGICAISWVSPDQIIEILGTGNNYKAKNKWLFPSKQSKKLWNQPLVSKYSLIVLLKRYSCWFYFGTMARWPLSKKVSDYFHEQKRRKKCVGIKYLNCCFLWSYNSNLWVFVIQNVIYPYFKIFWGP